MPSCDCSFCLKENHIVTKRFENKLKIWGHLSMQTLYRNAQSHSHSPRRVSTSCTVSKQYIIREKLVWFAWIFFNVREKKVVRFSENQELGNRNFALYKIQYFSWLPTIFLRSMVIWWTMFASFLQFFFTENHSKSGEFVSSFFCYRYWSINKPSFLFWQCAWQCFKS